MAFALGLGMVDEVRARMAGGAVVDVLDLARREVELDPKLGSIEHRLHGGKGGRRLVVHALAAQFIAGEDLGQREPGLHRAVGGALEDRRGEGRGFVGRVLGVAVVPERLVEPIHQLGEPLLQRLVHRGDAHHLADTALLGRMQAEQADIVGRRFVVGIVVVEAQVDVGHGRPDARAGLQLGAGVAHVEEHLAVQLLRHRTGEQARQQPVELDRLIATDLGHRQAIEHGEHRPILRHAPHLGHGRAAGVEREVGGVEQEGRQRRASQLRQHRAQLGKRGRRQRHRPVGWLDRVARPGLRGSHRTHRSSPAISP